jgi:Ca-activated chloride channel homolog
MNLPVPRLDLTLDRGALPAGGGRVHALLRVAVDFPEAEREREPLSLAIVIDRSGSMSGDPLEHARRSAAAAVMALRDGDRVAVVAFDDRVDVVAPSTAVTTDRGAIVGAIRTIREGGSTALHAGWVEGCTQVLTAPVASGLGRVVLLSDGQANVGIVDPASIAADVARVTADGVTTSAIGLGRHFDERMMRHIADAGQGSYTFVETPDQLEGLFETELSGISALRGRGPALTLLGSGVRVAAAAGGARVEGGLLHLPDLIAGLPRELLLSLDVAPDADLRGLALTWDDTFSRRRETLEVALAVPTLPDAEVALRPSAPSVAMAVRVASLAQRVAHVEELARSHRLDDAERELEALRAEVAAWPADAERDAQLAGLVRLLGAVRDRDEAMSQKLAHMLNYERDRGVRLEHMKLMSSAESAWTVDHKAAKAGPRPSSAAPSFRLRRADGSEARIEVVVGDITDQALDAIVNPSNRGLFGTAGVDGAIHRRGGPELTAACRAIGEIDYGQAVATPGFRLPAGRVIHTTTLPWRDGASGEFKSLHAAYGAAFALAQRLRLRTLAVPAIGTGAYGYPLEPATDIAVEVAVRELSSPGRLQLVRFVLFERSLAALYARVLAAALQASA